MGLESRDLQWGNFVFDRLEVSARGDAHAVEISRIEGTFRDAVATTESRLAGRAGFAPAWLPTTAELPLGSLSPELAARLGS